MADELEKCPLCALLKQAIEAHLAALPRCQKPGCSAPLTGYAYLDGGGRCDEHGQPIDGHPTVCPDPLAPSLRALQEAIRRG